MTEMTNAERVGDIFGAFARGDIPNILDQLTDDVRWVAHLDPSIPWAEQLYSSRASVIPSMPGWARDRMSTATAVSWLLRPENPAGS